MGGRQGFTGKHTTPKEDDQEYLLTSPNGESAQLCFFKTYCEEYNLAWTFRLDDAAYHKRNVNIACNAANSPAVGGQTTWLDNVPTDKFISEPMLLPSVHLRHWFQKTLLPSPNTRKTNCPMYSPRHCHGTRIAFFVTFFIRFIS